MIEIKETAIYTIDVVAHQVVSETVSVLQGVVQCCWGGPGEGGQALHSALHVLQPAFIYRYNVGIKYRVYIKYQVSRLYKVMCSQLTAKD